MFSAKPKKIASTRFSDFIRDASSAERKKVYNLVLVRATERQERIVKEAASKKA